ncbi:MAG: MaoC family dehydratase N-terminal domain-containing protein [Rhizobiaceae bacterium]|nr:MaoC family dehydratase N-terminal domain-containing protein [Rhizobiaceae bacterium]
MSVGDNQKQADASEPTKIVIDGLDGFRALKGAKLGPTPPITVTQAMIEQFCTSVQNEEWTHWDVERAKASPFGATIAPGMLTPAYFPKLWFDLVDLRNIDTMLLMGSDRIRLLSPLKCGSQFTMTAEIREVEEREKGIAVHIDATFNVVGQERPVSVTNFIIRYM